METQPAKSLPRPDRTFLELSEKRVEQGARRAVSQVRGAYRDWLWVFNNLPRNHRQAICGLLHVIQLAQAASVSRQSIPKTEAPCDELKEDLSDAFCGRFVSNELMYLAHVVEQWRVPKQFIFEPLEALDRLWRFGQPATFEEALGTATRWGGAMMQQLVLVLEPEKPGFETPARKIGQALSLAWWLWRLADDAATARTICLPHQDLAEAQIDLNRLRERQPQKSLHHLVRLYGHRIDRLLAEGGPLFEHLGYDGQRVLKTLLGICWRGLCSVRLNPDRLLKPESIWGDRGWWGLRARHFLGLDAALPFAKPPNESH